MQSLGVQAVNLIQKRFDRVVEQAAKPFLLEVFKKMNELTLNGKSFDGLEYIPNAGNVKGSVYSKSHTKKRVLGGYQVDKIYLRMGNRRIERYRYTNEGSKNYAEIGFETPEDGRIFYVHHTGSYKGSAKGKYIREIFPKEWYQVPHLPEIQAFHC